MFCVFNTGTSYLQNSIKVQIYQWHHIFFLQKHLITKIGGSDFKNHLEKDMSRYVYCLTRIITWNTVFDINSNEWKQIYILPFKATACTKLHWFQFRINHNILATNYFLKKIKIIDDANCNFCQKENETIEHIFGGCENVQNLLGQVNSWFGDKDINQTFLKKTLIFGDVDKVYKDDVCNAILLNIKYYIYTNRCLKKKLSFHSLKACLINLYKTEKKMIAVRNQRIAEFQLHWSTFEKLFEDC